MSVGPARLSSPSRAIWCFATAGVVAGLVETAEHMLVAVHYPAHRWADGFGLSSALQGCGMLQRELHRRCAVGGAVPAGRTLWAFPAVTACLAASRSPGPPHPATSSRPHDR